MFPNAPAFYSINRFTPIAEGYFGCECACCGRQIQAPHRFQRQVIWCLYCGMERGRVPMVEVRFGFVYDLGITADEAQQIEAECARPGGDVDAWCVRRAKALGQVWGSIG